MSGGGYHYSVCVYLYKFSLVLMSMMLCVLSSFDNIKLSQLITLVSLVGV